MTELFTSSEDGTCRCVDLQTGKCTRMYRAKGPVQHLHLTSSSLILLLRNGTLKRYVPWPGQMRSRCGS